MSDRTCPRCGAPLTTALETDQATGTTPPTREGDASAGQPPSCAACGWPAADDDLPGSLGGDNGGA